jgi:hypothetical protein
VFASSSSLLIRTHNRARYQAEIPLIAPTEIVEPPLYIALVLPITFLSGVAWTGCRELIRKNYSEVTIVTIASSASGSFAFSADTDTGECLVVAHKTETPAKRINSVSLTSKPGAPYEGTEIARLIRETIEGDRVATLEGGPLGRSSH